MIRTLQPSARNARPWRGGRSQNTGTSGANGAAAQQAPTAGAPCRPSPSNALCRGPERNERRNTSGTRAMAGPTRSSGRLLRRHALACSLLSDPLNGLTDAADRHAVRHIGGVNAVPAVRSCPAATTAYNLGSSSHRFATVYAGTGAINTSDAREKTESCAAHLRTARGAARDGVRGSCTSGWRAWR